MTEEKQQNTSMELNNRNKRLKARKFWLTLKQLMSVAVPMTSMYELVTLSYYKTLQKKQAENIALYIQTSVSLNQIFDGIADAAPLQFTRPQVHVDVRSFALGD
jgi:hypothetical protein